MLRIQQRERQVYIDPHILTGGFPHQEDAQDFVGAGKRYSPSLMAAGEFLTRHVTFWIARHGLGEDEREHVRVGAVVHLDEAVEKSHGGVVE